MNMMKDGNIGWTANAKLMHDTLTAAMNRQHDFQAYSTTIWQILRRRYFNMMVSNSVGLSSDMRNILAGLNE